MVFCSVVSCCCIVVNNELVSIETSHPFINNMHYLTLCGSEYNSFKEAILVPLVLLECSSHAEFRTNWNEVWQVYVMNK